CLICRLDVAPGGSVGVAEGAVAGAGCRELEGRLPVPERLFGCRFLVPLVVSERADVQASRAVAHETHDGFVDDDAIDDETPPEEREEAEPHAEPPRGEEGLCRVERRVVADRDALEGDAETAAE